MIKYDDNASPIPISPATLTLPLVGRNLHTDRLGEELGPGSTLLAFLRHLG